MNDTQQTKDVRLTLVGWGDDEKTTVNFEQIGRHMKQMLVRWLCLAVGLGMLVYAVGTAVQQIFLSSEIKTLVSLSDDSSEAGYDIRKIKSPAVVEYALNDLKMDVRRMEMIRNAISIQGVIPDSAQNQISMYFKILSQSGSNAVSTVQSLLNTQYDITSYIISLDYPAANMSREEGLDFMNALLRSYQNYFAEYYNENEAMGTPLKGIDYREYDYAEAVAIFSNALDIILDYLSNINETETESFRSVQTGFTFDDLRRDAATLRDIDLDRIASFVVVHSVSSYDSSVEISYYEWLIENLTRQRTVERTHLDSLSRSIAEYEKNPILMAVQEDSSIASNMEDLNVNYDNMITEKLQTQSVIASYNRSISYYESVIEKFTYAEVSTPEDIEMVKEYLADFNEKLNTLVENTAQTVDEYYSKVAFSDRIRILIPASTGSSPIISKVALMSGIATMAVVFCVYFAIAVLKSIRREEMQCDEGIKQSH